MAASVRRLLSLRSSLSSLTARSLSSTISSAPGYNFIPTVDTECGDQFAVDQPLRNHPSTGGHSAFLGLGARGFAAKAKKSGGKARSDDGGGQMLSTPGPSSKETASRLMDAALNALSVELSKLRTGRASPGMLDHVNVTSHGVVTPLLHVAAVSISSLEMLTVMPYDASIVKEVEKAIRSSPLKLNPVEEGEVLRVPIPKLTKEHMQTMSKLVGKAGEIAKLSVRRARKDAMDIIAKGGFSKDEVKRFEKEVEDVTKKYVKSVEEACKSKEKEILGNS